jgi:hypothetical protein
VSAGTAHSSRSSARSKRGASRRSSITPQGAVSFVPAEAPAGGERKPRRRGQGTWQPGARARPDPSPRRCRPCLTPKTGYRLLDGPRGTKVPANRQGRRPRVVGRPRRCTRWSATARLQCELTDWPALRPAAHTQGVQPKLPLRNGGRLRRRIRMHGARALYPRSRRET